MVLKRSNSEERIPFEDLNEKGESYHDLVAAENRRHNQYVAKLQKKSKTETTLHRRNLQGIDKRFGLEQREEPNCKLTRKEKAAIKRRVKVWSKCDPQSGCKNYWWNLFK